MPSTPAAPDALRTVAGTAADYVRERLIAHRPVNDHHNALILAYTIKATRALTDVCDAHGIGLDLSGIATATDAALAEAASRRPSRTPGKPPQASSSATTTS